MSHCAIEPKTGDSYQKAVVYWPERNAKVLAQVRKALETNSDTVTDDRQTGNAIGDAAQLREIMLPDMAQLNDDQRAAATVLLDYLCLGQLETVDNIRAPKLLIHGGPGCGKTHFVNFVTKCAQLLQIQVICGAFAASAARNMPDGQTLHSICAFGLGSLAQQRTLSSSKLMELRARYSKARVLVIDEISMVDPVMLSALSARLGQIMGQPTQDFGGLAVLALGDFLQIPPVSGASFPQALLDPKPVPPGSSRADGVRLFSLFQLFNFSIQERARGDEFWCRVISVLRSDKSITPATLQHIVPLSAADVQRDGDWLFAPVAVCGNEERAALNFQQMQRFARHTGTVMIAWRKPIVRAFAELSNNECEQLWNTDPRLIGCFVVGAPAFLSENLNSVATSKGICNGAAATLHSLSFGTAEESASVEIQITQLLGNQDQTAILWLERPPLSINVKLPDTSVLESAETLVAGQAVVPLFSAESEKLQIVTSSGRAGKIKVSDFSVEPAFAITFHKLQGKTLPKLLVNLNKTPHPPHITFEFAYVALTRVRCGADVRALPPPVGKTFSHLCKLKADSKTVAWLNGFDDHGNWNRQRSMDCLEMLQATPKRKRKPPQHVQKVTTPHPAQHHISIANTSSAILPPPSVTPLPPTVISVESSRITSQQTLASGEPPAQQAQSTLESSHIASQQTLISGQSSHSASQETSRIASFQTLISGELSQTSLQWQPIPWERNLCYLDAALHAVQTTVPFTQQHTQLSETILWRLANRLYDVETTSNERKQLRNTFEQQLRAGNSHFLPADLEFGAPNDVFDAYRDIIDATEKNLLSIKVYQQLTI